MAVHEREAHNTLFLEIKYHSLCEVSKKARPGLEPIEVVNPTTKEKLIKYYHPYGGVDGFVTGIEWYDRRDNKNKRYVGYKLKLDADGQPVQIDIAYGTRAFDVFLKVAENVDWTQRVHFSAWHDRKEDATAFLVRQGDRTGTPMKRAFTKDNPKGMPPAKEGLKGWDYSEQEIWLRERFEAVVVPRILAAAAGREVAPMVSKQELTDTVQAPRARAVAANAPDDPYGDGPLDETFEPDPNDIPF